MIYKNLLCSPVRFSSANMPQQDSPRSCIPFCTTRPTCLRTSQFASSSQCFRLSARRSAPRSSTETPNKARLISTERAGRFKFCINTQIRLQMNQNLPDYFSDLKCPGRKAQFTAFSGPSLIQSSCCKPFYEP